MAALLAASCSVTTGVLPTSSSADSRRETTAQRDPLPYFPPECVTATPTVPMRDGLGDLGLYNSVCRTGWDGRVTPLAFSTLLGGEDSDATASFRYTAAILSQRSRDVISFPGWVRPSHFDPIPWNSATDGPRRTEPGIRGEFRLLGRETVTYAPPDGAKPETCVPVSFTLPPQDTPWGRLAGTTTRLLRCASDHVYRVPTFGS